MQRKQSDIGTRVPGRAASQPRAGLSSSTEGAYVCAEQSRAGLPPPAYLPTAGTPAQGCHTVPPHGAARAQRPPLQPTLIRFPLVSPALDTEEGKTAPIQARPRED